MGRLICRVRAKGGELSLRGSVSVRVFLAAQSPAGAEACACAGAGPGAAEERADAQHAARQAGRLHLHRPRRQRDLPRRGRLCGRVPVLPVMLPPTDCAALSLHGMMCVCVVVVDSALEVLS